MYCKRCSERGKQNPNRLAGGLTNERHQHGCSCIQTVQWQLARSQQGGAVGQRVVVVSEQQNPEGLNTDWKEEEDFAKGKSSLALPFDWK